VCLFLIAVKLWVT